ncbi:MAG: ABC transporter ATP-binding protein [Candidatus Doudnabacteria bacterium RIFCSPLOWO2_02_FULL_49_13]|uniref:ABC transporter ATP-binding protein n=1 Tax=Candidatus Doudnabacteria bacterium RIFCSPHIGHO2_12_FULL_48_16 TaxID=1817838 RepID=A0A1F5PJH3_9BACT|nr:MAG: ABC transporter ATP-binding protein [Candidatus Doudnabacteria bacterium RIFCSPHIGHO2_02_FULL_49_24]OGE89230.1 MAG: ABC transporter ATP-binding protein [Candidatus Doudnabacteria bacterium RIFCSPHIGHO2_01_FULL_50_67]OGE90093.1 MAG: ABC transporter ATP-binding protein [Candidatus Doudnabacteria bacterium RIFCSPHIGHO2_12_FULL_48_16]OGE97124.1 MAG: ABC transporter ATP-binding protein [Candidatus Doudnabacteria bacterium RIFCSPLOWO2_01_FULL_49_40]OGF03237.1 MAG: ABC transporter ATP-binding 
MKLLWSYLKRYKKILFGTLALAVVNQVFSLLDPQIFRLLVDNYISRARELSRGDFLHGVLLLLLGTVGVALVSRIAKNFQDYYLNVVVQKVGTQMYSHSVQHSFSLPYAVFEDQRSGEFLQKLQKARTDAQLFITSSVNILFLSLVGIVFVVAYALYVNWMVGLVYFLIIPVLGGTTYLISRKIKAAQVRIITETAALAGSTTETLRNVELVKSLGLENQEIKRLNDTNSQILTLELEKIKIIRKFSFIQGTMINALRSALMFLMLWLIYTGAVTFGQFFSLLFYSFFIFNPLASLGEVAQQYQEAKASLDRLDEILRIQPEAKPEKPVVIKKLEAISFQEVSFKYETADKPALENINVEIKSGQTVAFVGPSGSGKTTLVKLIVGLYKPTGGRIEFAGTDVRQIDMEKFRNRIGLVAQDTQLFAGTIRENLLFASPNATDEQCLAALRAAAADSLLDRGLPATASRALQAGGQGLETKIGEGGLKLSGGEKQRLAIARALLRDPDLLIFDEATSSLDSITEEQITQTIKEIEKQRASHINVLVAHRLSTIMHADMIYVLEKGKLVEQGSHDGLLNQHGLYAALWRQQIASKEKEFAVV